MAEEESKFEERRARGVTEWAEAETADGEVYYFNKRTKETCWELPSDEVLFAEIAELPTAEVVVEPMEIEAADERIERMRSQYLQSRKYSISEPVAQQHFRTPLICMVITGGIALVGVAVILFFSEQGTIEPGKEGEYLAILGAVLSTGVLLVFLHAFFSYHETHEQDADDFARAQSMKFEHSHKLRAARMSRGGRGHREREHAIKKKGGGGGGRSFATYSSPLGLEKDPYRSDSRDSYEEYKRMKKKKMEAFASGGSFSSFSGSFRSFSSPMARGERAWKKSRMANARMSESTKCCYISLFMFFACAVAFGVWFVHSGKMDELINNTANAAAASTVPGLELAGLGYNALYGTESSRSVVKMDTFTLDKRFLDGVSQKSFKIPDSIQNVYREPSCRSSIDVTEYKTVEEYTNGHTVGLTVGVPIQAGALSLSPEVSWTNQKMTETNGYVYEAKVECSEYRAALNTSPEEKEAKTWVRAYMLGLGIALLVVSGVVGLVLMYRSSVDFKQSRSHFCKYVLRAILAISSLAGIILVLYGSVQMLDSSYEAVVVIDPSFTAAINALPNDFQSGHDKTQWWTFFGNYGTHYYDSIVTGGRMQTNTIFSEEYVMSKKSFEVKIQAKALLGGVSLGPSYGYTDDDVKKATENSKATKQFQAGGDATVFFEQGWEAWVSTLDAKPAIMDFKIKPLYYLVPDPERRKIVKDATLFYLDFVGTAANPGQSCVEVREAMKIKYSVPLNSGVFYVKRSSTSSNTMVWCDFDLSIAGGGWTLAVNKKLGWNGDFKPALSWLASTAINTKKPSMSSDYKLPFANYFSGVKGAEIMLQYNPTAFSGSRIFAKLAASGSWEYYTHPNSGNVGARHLIDTAATNAMNDGTFNWNPSTLDIKINDTTSNSTSANGQRRRALSETKLYLVLSYDGGICIVPQTAAIESSLQGFSCDGDNGLSQGQGLFDASSSNEFANCNTGGWKDTPGGAVEEVYWSGSCGSVNFGVSDCDPMCDRGGQCVNRNGCDTHFSSDSRGCGFLNAGCQPKCRLVKNNSQYLRL